MHSQLLFVIIFIVRLCTSIPQETKLTPTIHPDLTVTPTVCGNCYVVAGFNAVTVTAQGRQFSFGPTGLITASTGLPTGTDLQTTAFLVFTAYSVTSTILTNGQCSVSSGPAVPVTPQSYALPSGSDQASFTVSAEQAFINSVGAPTCASGKQATIESVHNVITATPIVLGAFSVTSQIASASATNSTLVTSTTLPRQSLAVLPSTASTAPTSPSLTPTVVGLNTGVKVGIGIAVPLGTIALFMLGIYLWRKDRRQRQAALQDGTSDSFIRQKAELDAEQRRHEMEARERRHELGEGAGRHELEAKNRRQELKAEDHSRELEAPK